MSADEPLFDVEPVARLQAGDLVQVQTIWGREMCTVEKVAADRDGFPMVQLATGSGDRITLNIARIQREEEA